MAPPPATQTQDAANDVRLNAKDYTEVRRPDDG